VFHDIFATQIYFGEFFVCYDGNNFMIYW